jgi:PAS domain S-box-containing protein
LLVYPAVFVSSWFGGRASGIAATILATAISAWYFVPPERTLAVEAHYLPSTMVFLVMGVAFAWFHARLRRAERDAIGAARERQIFLSLVESSSDFIGIADPAGRPVYVNPAGRRMVELSADHPIADTKLSDYYPVDERQAMAETGQWSGEAHLRNWKTEEAIPVSQERFTIRDAGGQRVLGIGTIARDISAARRMTREREAESARLYESEERFRLAIDDAPIGMALVALDGRFVRVNRAFCEIVGYPREELERIAFQDITHPADLATDLALAEQLARGEIPRYQLEKRYIRRDQTVVPVMLHKSLLRTSHGAPLYAITQIEDITQRKRAEEALQARERDLRSLAESMPQIVWVADASGLNVYFNQQWVDYTGLTLEQSRGEGWITPFHPDDRQRAWDAWQRAIKHHDSYSLECRMRRADGVYQWWLIRGVPLVAASGEILKWFGTCTDIEQIKVAEQKLKESEAKFSGIVSISPDAIISIDREQCITLFNDGAEQIFGYSRLEVMGSPVERLLPARLRQVHRKHLERFATDDASARLMGGRTLSLAGLRKTGEEFPAEAAISKLRIGDDVILTVALRDVSERKRIEDEQRLLAEAGAILSGSLDSDQTLETIARFVVRDFADWCIVEVADKHAPVRHRKVASRDPTQADSCGALEQLADHPYAAVAGSEPVVMERVTREQLEAIAPGPQQLQALRAVNPTSMMVLPLVRQGEILGSLSVISSTPARVFGRSDLRLAQALAERAAVAIENAALYDASVRATQLREQLLGFVAHDLRNPLGAITLQTSLLQRADGQPERRSRRPVEMIERAATRMNRLIQDILDVSRFEGGHLFVELARVPTERVVVEAVGTHRPLAASMSIELDLDVDPDVPDVWADRDRVLQVFENLIGNALKFTKPGGRITAGAAAHDGEVVLWVKDTGEGIQPEDLPHVFDRFWQAQKTRRAGAGLGLQIVKGIVEAHGGRLWIDSAVGVGTTVSFTVRSARAAGAQPTPAEIH